MSRNWPLVSLIADFTAGPPNLPGTTSVSLLASQTANRKITTNRGRQYELDQVQAGVLSADLTDQLEYLNPTNKGTFTSVLANSTFETGTAPWGAFGTSSFTQSSTQKHSGTFAGRLVPDGVTANVGLNSEQIPVIAGQIVTASTWVWFTNTVTSNFTLAVTWIDMNGVSLGLSPLTFVSATAATWTQVTGAFTPPATAVKATITMFLQGTPAAGQIWYVDDVTMFQTLSPTAPWNTSVNSLLPYRCVQYGAWWNSATKSTAGNFLNSANFIPGSTTTAYDPSFETTTSGFYAYQGSPTMTVSGLHFKSGTKSMSVVYAAASDIPMIGLFTAPGTQYTFSIWAFVPASHTVTARWNNYPGGVGTSIGTATSVSSGVWELLTITGVTTGPFSVVSLVVASGAFSATVFYDAMQLELGGSASAFTTSGPTYSAVYTGYIERFPQTWDSAGFRGIKPLECVDALSPLSRAVINQSYQQTVLADSPTVFIPYNDAALPQKVQLPMGGSPGTGTQILGTNSGAVTFGGDTFPDGSNAVELAQTNVSPPVSGNNNQVSWLGTYGYSTYLNPAAFTMELWVKNSGGPFSVGAAAMQPGETMGTSSLNPSNPMMLYQFASLTEFAVYWVDAGGTLRINSTLRDAAGNKVRPDGLWHHLIIELGFISGNYSWRYSWDGDTLSAWGTVSGGGIPPGQILNNFYASSSTYFGDIFTNISVGNVGFYNNLQLTQTQITNHYQRGIGYLGELSGTRAARILNKYWSTNIIAATGHTQMSSDFHYDPVVSPGQPASPMSVLSALQEIASTESGLIWADARGIVNFDARDTRYLNAKTPQYVFGENTSGGELPYEDIDYDFDPSYVYSEADLTAASGAVYTSVNAASQTAYGQRILSQQMYMANDWDVQQAANFFSQRYAVPPGGNGSTAPLRINRLTINPGSNPDLWAAALALDIGERVTVKRRTSPGITITGDYYIEQVSHAIDGDTASWVVDYQLSPVFNPTVWILGDATYGVLGTTTVTVY